MKKDWGNVGGTGAQGDEGPQDFEVMLEKKDYRV